MQVVGLSSLRSRFRVRIGLVAMVLSGAVLLAASAPASATTAVARFVYSPSPIGTPNTMPTNHIATITLSVEDSQGGLIPHATVYMTFVQASGGGAASIGGFSLNSRPQPEIADGNGHITISYTTPPTFPSGGCDTVHAQDQPKFSESTVKKADSFCFSTITSIGFTPTPIAPPKSLPPNSRLTITVSVFGTGGSIYANGIAWVSFRPTAGGGSASVGTTALTTTPKAFTTNALGEIFVMYAVRSTLPTSGTDRLIVGDGPQFPAVFSTDPYRY
jgi:hypothetical protein